MNRWDKIFITWPSALLGLRRLCDKNDWYSLILDLCWDLNLVRVGSRLAPNSLTCKQTWITFRFPPDHILSTTDALTAGLPSLVYTQSPVYCSIMLTILYTRLAGISLQCVHESLTPITLLFVTIQYSTTQYTKENHKHYANNKK